MLAVGSSSTNQRREAGREDGEEKEGEAKTKKLRKSRWDMPPQSGVVTGGASASASLAAPREQARREKLVLQRQVQQKLQMNHALQQLQQQQE